MSAGTVVRLAWLSFPAVLAYSSGCDAPHAGSTCMQSDIGVHTDSRASVIVMTVMTCHTCSCTSLMRRRRGVFSASDHWQSMGTLGCDGSESLPNSSFTIFENRSPPCSGHEVFTGTLRRFFLPPRGSIEPSSAHHCLGTRDQAIGQALQERVHC